MSKVIKEQIYIPQLKRERTLRIYLPDDYDNASENFPVIYMHDGQNLFDKKDSAYGMIWDVANTMDRLTKESRAYSSIIVGIDNAGNSTRLDEYSPWQSDVSQLNLSFLDKQIVGGEGEEYCRFFIETLIPHINSKYKTDTNKIYIGGSSMGGLISLYIGLSHPEIFKGIIAMSTAIWFAKEELFDFINKVQFGKNVKIYLDIGTEETSDDSIKEFPDIYLNDSKELYQMLMTLIPDKNNLKFVIDEGAPHNELQWARRLPFALKWLLSGISIQNQI